MQEFAGKVCEGICKERLNCQEWNAKNGIFDLSWFSPPKISLRANSEQLRAIMWEVCGVTCCRTGLSLGRVGSEPEQFLCLAKATFLTGISWLQTANRARGTQIMSVSVMIEENLGFLNSLHHNLALARFWESLIDAEPVLPQISVRAKRNWNVRLSRRDQSWNFHFHGI